MPKLTIQIPDGEEAAYEFDDERVTIGRNADCSIHIPHGSMSGLHAQLVRNDDGSYTLSDNQSTNGTFVNGAQVFETVLQDGAEILFGSVAAHYSQPQAYSAGGGYQEPAYEQESHAPAFQAEQLSASGRPANFHSVSPFPKRVKKKDPSAGLVMMLGFLSLLGAFALAGIVYMKLIMEAS